MNLILSDKQLSIPINDTSTVWFDVSALKISNCIGCFGCWTKTPGRCVIRDDAVKVYPKIAASRKVMYISKVKYGGYDTAMKTVLERAIPIQQAFIRLLDGETHHVQRTVVPKQATIIGYGNISEEEKSLFGQLVERNSKNMCFEDYRVICVSESLLEQTVKDEVAKWEES